MKILAQAFAGFGPLAGTDWLVDLVCSRGEVQGTHTRPLATTRVPPLAGFVECFGFPTVSPSLRSGQALWATLCRPSGTPVCHEIRPHVLLRDCYLFMGQELHEAVPVRRDQENGATCPSLALRLQCQNLGS